jgi:tripartite-type tricarboxylate transporter receptor subunit TctC
MDNGQLTTKCKIALAAVLPLVIVNCPLSMAADSYPARPLRFILPYPPGGGNDFVARVLANKLAESIRQQVVIDNRGGAHGIIATELTAKAPPDGYTIFMCGTGHAFNPYMYKKLPYDSEKDFAPVSLVAVAPNVLVLHPSVPATSVRELIALAKAKPASLTFGSSGGGGNTHLAGELLKLLADIDIVHVPYRGTGPAVTALLSGEVQMMFSTLPPVLPQIRAGRLRALAVTGAKRTAAAPALPTMAEAAVFNYEASGWWGVLMPGKTPPAIVMALNAEIVKVLSADATKTQLARDGIEAAPSTPAQFSAHMRAEGSKWAAVIKAANIQGE